MVKHSEENRFFGQKRNLNMGKILWLSRSIAVSCFFLLISCVSTQKERQMRSDIFALQTKMVEMERLIEERGRVSEDTIGKRLASTSNQVDKLTGDFARVKGEIDALKVGVTTGQMPGTEGSEIEGSVAALSIAQQIKLLSEKLEVLERQQQEIIAGVGKKEKSVAGSLAASEKVPASKVVSSKDVLKSFEKKKYKFVVEQAPLLMKALKGSDLQDVTFAYAESLFRTGQHRESALKYNDFIDLKPDTAKVPHAKMRMGDCFRSLGDQATAKLYYQEILDKHPESNEAAKAKERLQASAKKGAMRKKPGGVLQHNPVHARSTKPDRAG